VTFCLGVIKGEIMEFKTSFSPKMAVKGKTLLTALHLISTTDQDHTMQSFLFLIFSQKRCGDTGGEGSLTQWVCCGYIVGSGAIRPHYTQWVHAEYFMKEPINSPTKNPVGKGVSSL